MSLFYKYMLTYDNYFPRILKLDKFNKNLHKVYKKYKLSR